MPSVGKEISSGISLEGMMLKPKLQYLGNFMRRVDSLEKTLVLGGIGGRRMGNFIFQAFQKGHGCVGGFPGVKRLQ